MDVCGCSQHSAPVQDDINNNEGDYTDDTDEDSIKMFFFRTAEQNAAFKRLALELETDAKLVTLAGWRPYTRPRDLRKTFVSFSLVKFYA